MAHLRLGLLGNIVAAATGLAAPVVALAADEPRSAPQVEMSAPPSPAQKFPGPTVLGVETWGSGQNTLAPPNSSGGSAGVTIRPSNKSGGRGFHSAPGGHPTYRGADGAPI
jgi:hypothetical protein